MGRKEKKAGDFVGFSPNKTGGSIDYFNKIERPLIERAVLQGEEGEGETDKNRKKGERPFENENEIAGVKKIGNQETARQLQELFECHVSHETELVLGDVLGDGVLLHTLSVYQLVLGFKD
jgi:hypothetical protein